VTLSELATILKASPKSYDLLTTQQKQDFRETLAPKVDGFEGQQRTWFRDWWFVCTQAQLDTMNAALPANVRINAVDYLGVLYINIDLATDCMQLTDTYGAARSVIRTLICTNVPNLPNLI
jgi:hypothetical protein